MPYHDAKLEQVSEAARELLQGAIDIHVHFAPDPYTERRLDARQLVEKAREAGIGGLVLKSHEYPTQPLAWLLDQEYDGIDVYGGLALDWGVGGLNVEAVSVSLSIGAKLVWMPTFDAQAWREARPGRWNSPGPGLTVLDERGNLSHELMAILDMIQEHDSVLASGHLSTMETLALIRESRRRGIRSVITHGSFWIDLEVQQELATLGAYVEQVSVATTYEDGEEQWERIQQQVRAVGPEHVILSTDLGQAANAEPPTGFGMWIERFLDAGFSGTDVRRMVLENPKALIT